MEDKDLSQKTNNEMTEQQNIKMIQAKEEMTIFKIKVKKDWKVFDGHILLLYEPTTGSDGMIKKMLKCTESGIIKKIYVKDGQKISIGSNIFELETESCKHPTVMKDLCAQCGADLQDDENDDVNNQKASISMIHMVPELKVNNQTAQVLGKAEMDRLLNEKKLILLVDLDQTLIHTTNDNIPVNIKDVHHFQLYGPMSPWYHTRLRPGTQNFLAKISELFELHICTFGSRRYAHTIAKFLDPDGKFFSHRILSRDECFSANSKTANLKELFPCGESMVCIIDDREDVWDYASNLIHVKPYHFFQHTGDINAPDGLAKTEQDDSDKGIDFTKIRDKSSDDVNDSLNEVSNKTSNYEETNDNRKELEANNIKDEEISKTIEDSVTSDKINGDKLEIQNSGNEEVSDCVSSAANVIHRLDDKGELVIEETDDYLLHLEEILRNLHNEYFNRYEISKEHCEIPDLKKIVPETRNTILRDCSIVFSGMFPSRTKLEESQAYKIARSLGAKVIQNIEEDTTHLVAVRAGTAKVHAAKRKDGIKIVSADWLWICAERWEKVDERLYPLDDVSKQNTESRHPPNHCRSPEHDGNKDWGLPNRKSIVSNTETYEPWLPVNDSETIFPTITLSSADIAYMHEEVDDDCDSTDDEEYENTNDNSIGCKPLKLTKCKTQMDNHLLNTNSSSNSDSDVEVEDGVPMKKRRIISTDENIHDGDDAAMDMDDSELEESITSKFRRGAELPSDVELENDSNDYDYKNDF